MAPPACKLGQTTNSEAEKNRPDEDSEAFERLSTIPLAGVRRLEAVGPHGQKEADTVEPSADGNSHAMMKRISMACAKGVIRW